MTNEAIQNTERPLPNNLVYYENKIVRVSYLMPLNTYRVDMILGKGGGHTARFDSVNQVIKPLLRDPESPTSSRLYDHDRLLALAELHEIRTIGGRRNGKKTDEEIILEWREKLSGTKLDYLVDWNISTSSQPS